MALKKLAILCDWYLPGTKAGGPVRSIYSLIELLKNQFDIYVITRHTDLGSEIPYSDVQANEWIQKESVHYFYFSKQELTIENIEGILNDINCDTLYLNSFWSYYFSIGIIHLKNSGKIKGKLVLAPRGMLGKGALEVKKLKKYIYIFSSKVRNSYRLVHFHASNEQEKSDILKHFPKAHISIIPNVNISATEHITKSKQKNHLKLFFLSRIVPIKNLHFALNILRNISPEFTINYSIYGNIEDKEYWETCCKLIEQLPAHIKVHYKGELAFHEVANTIRHEHCLLLPTKNENFGHSIVESLMCGCSAIISDQTPWNDLQENGAGFATANENIDKWKNIIESYARKNETELNEDARKAVAYISRKINIPLAKEQYTLLFDGTR
jgi:glycosyltransferase involved in cell wall biosynthesis